ncbi:hypothetical protein NEOLEDRAFT_1183581 [Neolentinus lepideus HHB14362 ss-1]|uniref:Uncharacterized protein n=1 Tax=Neolentinus lepideus HHB14362 ss-1 TaxID=1314782 RepID=A0A165N552_9AGAM|nr:hypothetical protein NEOLEDRAFT_1184339 [Neolentinus lepideus HHB14362 ss-1]KZT19192.1 hypothetical protein NEOLEDRAFT_1183581 [Neolentinus lepideus HHB14362 ss-1]
MRLFLATLQGYNPFTLSSSSSNTGSGAQYDPGVSGFFAHWVVNNASATPAVMDALGNIPSLPSGPQLQELFSFTTGVDASLDWSHTLSPSSASFLDSMGFR